MGSGMIVSDGTTEWRLMLGLQSMERRAGGNVL